MAIVDARAAIIERPAPSRLNTSYGEGVAARPHVMVRLTDDEGRVGYGEASPLPAFTGETAESILVQLRGQFLPALIGKSAFDTGPIHQELDRLPHNSSAKAAIDIALYDLMGKTVGLPAVALLGGAVRPDVPVTYPLGIDPVKETVATAVQAVEHGIRTLKMKIGWNPDADVERVRAVRQEVGPDVAIRIDANQGYDVPTATRIVSRLAEVGIEYVEQPVADWDFEGLAAVRRLTGVKVMADESLHTLRDAERLIQLGSADILAIKLIKTSGLTQARSIVALAAANRVEIVVISPFETQFGAAAGLALALAAPTAYRAHELRVFDSQPDLGTTGIRYERGRIIPSQAPGLGVDAIAEFENLEWPANDAPVRIGQVTTI
jgi:L-alanine-DL-glutamate epimerase-like enolase superfamily enzyme